VEQHARPAGAKEPEVTDRAEMHDVVAHLRDRKDRLTGVGVKRLGEHRVPMQVCAIRIAGIVRLVVNNGDPAFVAGGDPGHLSRANWWRRKPGYFEGAIKV